MTSVLVDDGESVMDRSNRDREREHERDWDQAVH
jgi:hypothetical protein